MGAERGEGGPRLVGGPDGRSLMEVSGGYPQPIRRDGYETSTPTQRGLQGSPLPHRPPLPTGVLIAGWHPVPEGTIYVAEKSFWDGPPTPMHGAQVCAGVHRPEHRRAYSGICPEVRDYSQKSGGRVCKLEGKGHRAGRGEAPTHSSTYQPLIVVPAFYLPSFQPVTPLTLHPSAVDRYCQVRKAGSEKSR